MYVYEMQGNKCLCTTNNEQKLRKIRKITMKLTFGKLLSA